MRACEYELCLGRLLPRRVITGGSDALRVRVCVRVCVRVLVRLGWLLLSKALTGGSGVLHVVCECV